MKLFSLLSKFLQVFLWRLKSLLLFNKPLALLGQ